MATWFCAICVATWFCAIRGASESGAFADREAAWNNKRHTRSSSGVAQWLACWAHNPKVRGSKPRSANFAMAVWIRCGCAASVCARWTSEARTVVQEERCASMFSFARCSCSSLRPGRSVRLSGDIVLCHLAGPAASGFFTDCKAARMRKRHTRSSSGVAQWLACWAHNPKVRGSKPRSANFALAVRFPWG